MAEIYGYVYQIQLGSHTYVGQHKYPYKKLDPTYYDQEVLSKMRQLRKKHTQTETAKHLGVSSSTISNWERIYG